MVKAATIQVKIYPRSSKQEIVGVLGKDIKIKLISPPLENKANKELVIFLSKKLFVPKSSIEIISGKKSTKKRIRILGLSEKEAIDRLFNRDS